MISKELIFEVHEAEEGGFWTRALGFDIFTQGDTWEELKANIREAIEVYFDEDEEHPHNLCSCIIIV